jgi:CRISPR/Cas system-associated exonuclease Cas4 (RecB family)
MDQLLNITAFIFLTGGVLVVAFYRTIFGLLSTSKKVRRSEMAPWNLMEFLQLRPSQWKSGEHYRFSEEQIRSSADRFVGRFDAAVLHWEEAPVLDVMMEYKFPISILPKGMREEDRFQAGLYSLALEEYGISCSSARLVIIYCLQDAAKQCFQNASSRDCWTCSQGKIFEKKFRSNEVRRQLKKLDEVWYGKRSPRATPSESKCRACPFSKQGECKYAEI